ncbi:heme exporter protein B [Sphingomonas sp. F9_3S_D5_B_2]
MIGRLIARDLRRGLTGAAWLPIAFFLLVATLMPFAIGPDAALLGRVGAGALWIAALTAALLPIERLIEPDRADGVLDQLALGGAAEESIAAAKIVAHWLTFAPLLLIAAVPASALLGMDGRSLGRTELALAVGTPALAALTVAVAAVTAGMPRASSLAGVLLFPLAVPLLIFGAASSGGDSGGLLLEAAISLLLTAAAPFVAGASIRAARS